MLSVVWNASVVILPVLIGAVLFFAAVAKLISGPQSFINILREYRVLPPRLVPIIAWTIIAAEIGVGACLFGGCTASALSLLAALLFGAFGFGVVLNLIRGRTNISCGCFGAPETRISWWLALRNIGTASCALLMARISPPRLSTVDRFGTSLIVLGVVCTYVVFSSLLKLYHFPTQNAVTQSVESTTHEAL